MESGGSDGLPRAEPGPPDIEGAARMLAAAFESAWRGATPVAHLVLGSGLSGLAARVEESVHVPFGELPGFPGAGVVGHAGEFIGGSLAGRPVLVQAGRFHAYEGHGPETVGAPVRVAAALGSPVTILTNAAGGIARGMAPGDLMLIDDHLNLMGRAPLAGPVRDGEERFPDMSAPYDRDLQAVAVAAALERGLHLHRGVYAAVLGPAYETPAEVRMLAGLGADAVGMSTAPEAIVARAAGVRALGFSLITNAAAGLGATGSGATGVGATGVGGTGVGGTGLGGTLDHAEVVEVGREAGQRLGALIEDVLGRLEPR